MNEMRRDSSNIPRNENFAFMLDTFYDRRNGAVFEVTPLGGRMDAQVTNERTLNISWNPVWELATGRFEQGWTVEARIPFKSLRYRRGGTQVWGFQVRRKNLWKNEISYLAPVPAAIGEAGHFRAVSLAATLVGIDVPPGGTNLEIKPYVVSSLTSDNTVQPRVRNDPTGDAGLDVKVGLTPNLTADLTYNTDFAQVEADEQQINLTRFSLFFPEKRDFFLENQGTFEFGGAGGAAAGSAPGAGNSGDTPTLFYSRRIGLDRAGRAVPILGGGRLTGRAGAFSVGVLDIGTRRDEVSSSDATNFSVVRVKRDVLRKSSIGGIFTGRSVDQNGGGGNQAYGVDGAFGFYDNLTINTYWARTDSPSRPTDDVSYKAQLDYVGDRYGVRVERLRVGANFNPDIGFVRHPDMRRSFSELRFSPRPRGGRVRKLYWVGWIDYIENGAGRVDTRRRSGQFAVDFQNSDRLTVLGSDFYEYLPAPLRLAPEVVAAAGAYSYSSVQVGYNFGSQRKLASGNVLVERGTFYGGRKTSMDISRGRVSFPPHLAVEPTYSVNSVDLPVGRFTTHLLGSRVSYTMTPLMFASALVQYNSTAHAVSANLRFRWEYRPGSELFVVYNEQRDTGAARGFTSLGNRAVIVKVNRLFRL